MRASNAASTLDELERCIPERDKSKPSVSAWSVGLQIEHALLATRGICLTLIRSRPGEKRVSFSLRRALVFRMGRIPRHRGKAPAASIPSRESSGSELQKLLTSTRNVLARASECPPDSWWEHAVFGVMRRDMAIRFIGIHNRHHLAIISDILSD